MEADRTNLRYMLSEKKREVERLNEQVGFHDNQFCNFDWLISNY